MNPELQRRIWTDLTPRRLGFLALVLLILFGATLLVAPRGDKLSALGTLANTVFFFVVVLWGCRNAGESMAEDIRDRTWDLQRLSALSAWELTWGKLLGSTLFVWFGGLFCLVPIAISFAINGVPTIGDEGPRVGGIDIAFTTTLMIVLSAIAAQSGALFAVLLAARRQAAAARWSLVLGVGAGLFVWYLTELARSLIHFTTPSEALATIDWWGIAVPTRFFALFSLVALCFWLIAGCWRLMRRAVQLRPQLAWWLGFLAFVCLYGAGFAWNDNDAPQSIPALVLLIGGIIAGGFAFVTALVEPKDRSVLRRAATAVEQGRWLEAVRDVPAFVWPTGIAKVMMIVGSLLVLSLPLGKVDGTPFQVPLAFLFFLLRDLGIILFFCLGSKPGSGEFPALVTIALLYGVGGILGASSDVPELLAIFVPSDDASAWITVVAPMGQAAGIWFLALRRFWVIRKAA
jgi:hypothetical protein